MRQRLERGDATDAAEYFVEHVALGPGTWAQLPAEARKLFVANAPTFLGELRDPDALRADPAALNRPAAPLLLTSGDQSPAWFAAVIEVLQGTIPDVRRQRVPGAGHVPQLTHPEEYTEIVRGVLLEPDT